MPFSKNFQDYDILKSFRIELEVFTKLKCKIWDLSKKNPRIMFEDLLSDYSLL